MQDDYDFESCPDRVGYLGDHQVLRKAIKKGMRPDRRLVHGNLCCSYNFLKSNGQRYCRLLQDQMASATAESRTCEPAGH